MTKEKQTETEISPENLAALKAAVGQKTDPDGKDPSEGTPEPGPIIQRAKLSRGNMRRITKARDELDQALLDFKKAMDPLVFVADEDGKRIGTWPLLEEIDEIRAHITDRTGEVMAQQ